MGFWGKKRFIILTMTVVFLFVFVFFLSSRRQTEQSARSFPFAGKDAQENNSDQYYVIMVSKGFQNQFWQIVSLGAYEAASDYNMKLTFEGPPSESDSEIQMEQIRAAIEAKPDALCLAPLDANAVFSYLSDCMDKGIPVIGFDSGVPNAPAGTIATTVSTNNYKAGETAAGETFNAPGIEDKIKNATTDNPVILAVQSQDLNSESIFQRTLGFVEKMTELCQNIFPRGVEVSGDKRFEGKTTSKPFVKIQIVMADTPGEADAVTASEKILNMNGNLISVFLTNENSAKGMIQATKKGKELGEKGKYYGLVVIGFDAGKAQKEAVSKGYFYCSITQDPFAIGYVAVESAVRILNGETLPDKMDTLYKVYNAENMNEPEISQILYD